MLSRPQFQWKRCVIFNVFSCFISNIPKSEIGFDERKSVFDVICEWIYFNRAISTWQCDFTHIYSVITNIYMISSLTSFLTNIILYISTENKYVAIYCSGTIQDKKANAFKWPLLRTCIHRYKVRWYFDLLPLAITWEIRVIKTLSP